MAWGSSVMNYASKGFNMGASKIGRMNMTLATGSAVGGLYGATAGRDRGQSRIGGFATGALGGLAATRYGIGALRGGFRASKAYARMGSSMSQGAPSMLQRAQAFGMGAGRGAFRQMRSDATMARRHIGPKIRTNAGNAWSSMKSAFGRG